MFPAVPQKKHADGNHRHSSEMLKCSSFYHKYMRVSEAWQNGYSGRNIRIGMIDVGFIHSPSVRQHVHVSMSHDFHPNRSKRRGIPTEHISQEFCLFCDVGVAFNAQYADLHIGDVGTSDHAAFTDVETFAKALVYKQHLIDIYVCEWTFNFELDEFDFAIQSAIKSGVKEGRRGLGSVYVLPAGYPGDGFLHDTYVISVGSIDDFTKDFNATAINSATLVSVFVGDRGSEPPCFGPLSAPGIVAGMIAFMLEAKPQLSLRDVKHILIESSTHRGLVSAHKFEQNGAGKSFHPVFGFGYPNAVKMVELAKSWKELPTQYMLQYITSTRESNSRGETLEFAVNCNRKLCIKEIEQVVVQVRNVTSNRGALIRLKSPMGTVSTMYVSTAIPSERQFVLTKRDFLSSHFWGECSVGKWLLYCEECWLLSAKLVIHGKKGGLDKSFLCDSVQLDGVMDKSIGEMDSETRGLFGLIFFFVILVSFCCIYRKSRMPSNQKKS
ncbi:endoprotease bli-like [Mya arenaria]|uniref:endoprotease bli-like n=1 Tax=Mya arenaria TaxID=6604 RepID=UPI0022E942D2|nr:endoprotease bli-like [Mya arenaria]